MTGPQGGGRTAALGSLASEAAAPISWLLRRRSGSRSRARQSPASTRVLAGKLLAVRLRRDRIPREGGKRTDRSDVRAASEAGLGRKRLAGGIPGGGRSCNRIVLRDVATSATAAPTSCQCTVCQPSGKLELPWSSRACASVFSAGPPSAQDQHSWLGSAGVARLDERRICTGSCASQPECFVTRARARRARQAAGQCGGVRLG